MKDDKNSNESKGGGQSSPLDSYTVQPQNDQKDDSPFYKSAAPTIALPKGGGALKGIDEKFSVNAVNGTAGLEIGLPLSPGRAGFSPALSLSYNSGSGNSEFGLGWALGLPGIQRRTDKRLPQYNDTEESDTFLLAGAEDLIPELDINGNKVSFDAGIYTITRYRPRIEGLFARIEYIKKNNAPGGWWRVATKDNIITYYGLPIESGIVPGRIADPNEDMRIFKWLPQLTVDNKGNVQYFEYVAENLHNVQHQVNEKNRLDTIAPIANIYLKCVKYCNRQPYFINVSTVYEPSLIPFTSASFLMEAVFDYGDHIDAYSPAADQTIWPSRSDAFSDFHAGFEIRTYRRCKRVLMFHHFDELEGYDLVRSLELNYNNVDANATTNLFTEADFITSAIQKGHEYKGGEWHSKALPGMNFIYQPLEWDTRIHTVSKEDFRNAPQGLTGPYQWIDFEGEGISGILTEQGAGWYYKNNLGDGHFDTAKTIAPKPSYTGFGAGALQWQDLDADGRRQVVADRPTKGFWELDDDQEWSPFLTFAKNLNIDWDNPFTKSLDLNGDGRPDVIITEDMAWTWYENQGKKGFDKGGKSPVFNDEEKGPVLLLRDTIQSVFLADMSGDGMTDLVRIKNGEICYWPNMGYGRFGAKVAMVNAPFFQAPDNYNPQYLTLADISGTGAADLIYLGKNKCTAWINLSGNAWGPGVDINPLPGTDPYSKIAVLDFLGNGTGCIVWSSPLPRYATAPMQYIDLMGGNKPYLMQAYESGMGKSVTVAYKSSTKFYLEDKLQGIQWATRLPFPVHCIESITTRDIVSETEYTQQYRYRHGYYDHEEREFRGFGYVETLDVDIATVSDSEELNQPPVLTKTWNHTGAWIRGNDLLDQYKEEYFRFEGWDDLTIIATLPNPDTLNAQEWREAYRALKGLPLRQEIYAIDHTPYRDIPYSVTATAYTVKTVQKQGANRYASFRCYQQQSVAFSCERNQADPRIAHQLTLETDLYGNILKSAAVAYSRNVIPATLPEKVKAEQQVMHISYSENDFSNDIIDDILQYRLRLNYESSGFEILGLTEPPDLWTPEDLLGQIDETSEIDFSAPPSGAKERRQISKTRVLFKNNNADDTPLPLGTIESLAIGHGQYHLAYTNAIISYCYDIEVDNTMLEEAGYVDMDSDGNYWVPSGTASYDSVLSNFYTPIKFTDPWGHSSFIEFWGNYWLLPKATEDELGNRDTIERYNWRNLQPERMTDLNHNVSEILYDVLGMPVAMALKGKDNGTEGDELDGLDPLSVMDQDNQRRFWDDPETVADNLLQNATWRCVYDLNSLPVAVGMIARQEHYFNPGTSNTDKLIRLSYSDGFGRVIMNKAQCPGTIENGHKEWIGSGRTVYNNKGNAVMQYEPYFSENHLCDTAEQASEQGISPKLHYDALGRVFRTDMPDGTFSKTEWTSWEQTVWDTDDTVLDPDCTWYTDRIGGSKGPEEQEAAEKASALADTPTVMHTDTLARPFFTIQQDTITNYIHSYVNLDILGNRSSIVDGKRITADPVNDVPIIEYRYNLLKSPCLQQSRDSGTQLTFLDVAGQPYYIRDAEGNGFFFEYDILRRLTRKFFEAVLLEHIVYGESFTGGDPIDYNLRGQLLEHYDGGGKTSLAEGYDFKGNPKQTDRQLFEDKTLTDANWDAGPSLDAEVFSEFAIVDALNRPTLVTDPGGNETGYEYDRAGALIKVVFNGDEYVQDIHYNAKGQRNAIWYGNGTKTGYTYDALTYKLRRLLTINLITNVSLQDLNYYYDPVGNITRIDDDAQQEVFFNNSVVSPSQVFTYDALYRLIETEGRELIGLATFGSDDNWDDKSWISTNFKTDGSALQAYIQRYTYDAVGNILQLRHLADAGSFTRDYTYDDKDINNRLVQTIVGPDNYDYPGYDSRGNMLQMPHLDEMHWNLSNELYYIKTSIDINYQYSGGQRIRKYVDKGSGNIKEERIYLGNFEIYRKFDGSGSLIIRRNTVHISDDTGRIAMIEKRTYGSESNDNGTVGLLTRYIYSNHLQSATLELSETAEVISYEEYHPYGTTSFQEADAKVLACAKRYRYTGKERDEESGLYYHGARYYIPWLCRWTSVDPLESKYAGMSPYNYCANNPVMFNDPSGADPDDPKGFSTFSSVPTADNATVYQRPRSAEDGIINLNNVQPEIPFNNSTLNGAQQIWNTLSFEQRISAVDAAKSFDPEILIADMYGVGHIGRESVVVPIVNGIQQEYQNQVFGNIAGGPFGALGYWLGGEEGTFYGAAFDQISWGLHFSPAMGPVEPYQKVETNFGARVEQRPVEKYQFERNGYVYTPKVKATTEETFITHELQMKMTTNEPIVIGMSTITPNGTLTNAYEVPTPLKGQGASKAMYAASGEIGYKLISTSFSSSSDNFAEFIKVYQPLKGNFYEALMATPAAKAMPKGFYPNFIRVNSEKGVIKGISAYWLKSE